MKQYTHIIQGSNDPVVLELEGEFEFVKISASLTHKGVTEKTWEHDDVSVQDKNIILKLEESETMRLSSGYSEIDIKALDSSGRVVFFDIIKCIIDERKNKASMTGR